MKNYRRADCCRYCYNMDATEPPDEQYFCSIFHDPVDFDFVCDEYADCPPLSIELKKSIMGKFDDAIAALKEA